MLFLHCCKRCTEFYTNLKLFLIINAESAALVLYHDEVCEYNFRELFAIDSEAVLIVTDSQQNASYTYTLIYIIIIMLPSQNQTKIYNISIIVYIELRTSVEK